LPGNVKAAFVALACSAVAAVPDPELLEVENLETPILVGTAEGVTEDTPLDGEEVADVGTGDVEVGTDAEVVDMDVEVVNTGDVEVGTDAEVVDMDVEVVNTDDDEVGMDGVGTEITDDETEDAKVGAETDDGVTTAETELDGELGKAIEDGDMVWDLDIDGEGEGEFAPEPTGLGKAIETVQVLTSRTASLP